MRQGAADRKAPRGLAIALAAAEEAEIQALVPKRDHFVPDVRRVNREAQTALDQG